jgi:hypothetical protein
MVNNYYSFQYIQRSEFRNLKAIQINMRVEAVSFLFYERNIHKRAFTLFKADILQVTKCCPDLEHLTIYYLYEAEWDMHMQSYVVNISNLVALHQFKRLSSLYIVLDFKHFYDIHKVIDL